MSEGTDSVEDSIVQSLIQYHNDLLDGEYEDSECEPLVEPIPEAHYNHYGDRGVVDLHVRLGQITEFTTETTHEYVYEVKSESALHQSTGANEIIRQFKRHCAYFYQDPDRNCKAPIGKDGLGVSFELVFEPTQAVLEHVRDNWVLYQTLVDKHSQTKHVKGVNTNQQEVAVYFGHPNKPEKYAAYDGCTGDWCTHITRAQPEMAAMMEVTTNE